ncbi:hypothetical protein P40081_12280 [Paenibacillus sp. FSL P4-0081]|uniref:immunity protein YezG family protein n=1 Tax=Paenibacillus sp. FSL P4-0081 TaxID=1536769 RepID=UPI0004F6C165|nr:immunity protein YezG family protein [Paenibacillus sp. FSL P4-0081]AIQ28855.1 hypothetical protein P40081_12280 [Paenibacillus sp. FSL P4-0081]
MGKIEELYQLIGNKLVGIIPDEWDEIHLYAEILPGSRIVYFYYNSIPRNELIFGHNIPEIYGIDERIYDRLCSELEKCFVDLNAESSKNNPQQWTNLTMYLSQSGKFNINYNYDAVLYSPSQQRTIWKYEILGLHPTDGFHQKYLDEYLKTKTN